MGRRTLGGAFRFFHGGKQVIYRPYGATKDFLQLNREQDTFGRAVQLVQLAADFGLVAGFFGQSLDLCFRVTRSNARSVSDVQEQAQVVSANFNKNLTTWKSAVADARSKKSLPFRGAGKVISSSFFTILDLQDDTLNMVAGGVAALVFWTKMPQPVVSNVSYFPSRIPMNVPKIQGGASLSRVARSMKATKRKLAHS
mmetsp:Transcript_31700/g.51149  ORF Transcript_31700/g.51149 Transcript_31700/m.51149 type:complete len:198 (+) Transcript_31700:124-717(+)|eukprot:CAMPEP_0184656376 /NCGR_PEP_ID=MMETSP0308-20130426/16463_1 /TAXON_ID=38269 /ORGANISM="Gloeochaete witrockiana, Strain SAG 46.84" /LENGTH=197 /DNA_ID=CAMNT_0027093485 /DNA_START=124 /DNA_END=717 /DNA_ORIENTATION=-